MKPFLILTFYIFQFTLFAQPADTTAEKPMSFAVVDRHPIMQTCEDQKDYSKTCFQQSLLKYIADNFEYPEIAKQEGIGARIYLNFVVVTNVEVIRGAKNQLASREPAKVKAAEKLDAEAFRVVQSLRFVKPAMHKEKPVRMSFTLPINAKMD